jgi:cytochrome c-type biogenesis protein
VSVGSLVTDGPLLLAAPVAAAAGIVSFLSPCVLPLVPGYLSYVTGMSGAELSAEPAATPTASPPAGAPAPRDRATAAAPDPPDDAAASGAPAATLTAARPAAVRPARVRRSGRVVVGTALFILGFTAVFVSYGALFGDLGRRLIEHQHGLNQVLGILTIILGLLFAGVFGSLPLANREWRFHRLPAPGLAGAAVLGVLFGLGWTPCVGPTLAAVQGLAIDSATAARGAFLSALYCLGLGLPFLVVGVAFRRTAGAMVLLRRHARALQLVGGGMLVTLGLLELTGLWEDVLSAMRGVAPTFTPGL